MFQKIWILIKDLLSLFFVPKVHVTLIIYSNRVQTSNPTKKSEKKVSISSLTINFQKTKLIPKNIFTVNQSKNFHWKTEFDERIKFFDGVVKGSLASQN